MAVFIIDKITDLLGNVFKFKDNSGNDSSHTHNIANVNGLQSALNSKATQADIDSSVNTHNTDSNAHSDIRSAVSEGFTNVGNAITQEANSRVEGDSSVYNQLSQSIQNEADTRNETDQALGTAIQNLGNVKANADGSNASGTWGISISGKSERTDRVVGYSGGNSAANIYGFKIATITSNSTTNTCGFEAIASLKQGSNAGMLLMLIYAYMQGSTIRLSGRVINTSGWTSSLTPITLSAKTVDNGFDIYIEHPAFAYSQICVSPLGGRSSGATITYHSNQQLSSKLTGQASSYNLLMECCSTLLSKVGSITQPVHVNEYGLVQQCTGYGTSIITLSSADITLSSTDLNNYSTFLRTDTANRYLHFNRDNMVDGKAYHLYRTGASTRKPYVKFKLSSGSGKLYWYNTGSTAYTYDLNTSGVEGLVSTNASQPMLIVRSGNNIYVYGY